MKHRFKEKDICSVCKAEGNTLPLECPGREMTAEEMEEVRKGDRDFIDGGWIYVGGNSL